MVGSALWLTLAPPSGAAAIASLADGLAAIAPQKIGPRAPSDGWVAVALAAPLFALTTGPGAVVEPVVKLEGIVRSPGRVAALISVNGAASDWLALGQTRDGVTLQDVQSSKVVVETATGAKDIFIGAGSPSLELTHQAPPPRGFRSPPEPASAPGMPR